jgi:hypothetical protein
MNKAEKSVDTAEQKDRMANNWKSKQKEKTLDIAQ